MKSIAPIAAIAGLLAGCGTGLAILEDPKTGRMVECRENLFDGITDTIGRCVEAYEQAGFVVRGRR
jgi:hypothetical protein